MMLPADETRQRLFELAFDLVPEEEAAELRRRIEREPELAKTWAAVQESVGLLDAACRLKSPKADFRRSEGSGRSERSTRSKSSEPRKSRPAGNGQPSATKSASARRLRVLPSVIVVASALLLAAALGGLYYQRARLAEIAAGHLRLLVVGPSKLQAGVPNAYSFSTTNVRGKAVFSQVAVALYSAEGKQLFRQKEHTDPEGRLRLTIPGDLPIEPGARLEVIAAQGNEFEEKSFLLDVVPAKLQAVLATDRPIYSPGSTAFYRLLLLSAHGAASDRETPVRFELRDAQGAAVAIPILPGAANRGVVSGEFTIPDAFPLGEYELVGQSPDRFVSESVCRFSVRPAEALEKPSAERPVAAKTGEASSGPLRITFCPEGGAIAAGLENRVFFSASDAAGNPVEIAGVVVDRNDKEIAEARSGKHGLGVFSFFPAASEEPYRLKTLQAAKNAEFPLPRIAAEQPAVLRCDASVVDSGSPLKFSLFTTEKTPSPLIVAASCRGAVINPTAVVPDRSNTSFELPVAPEVAGLVRLTVFDARTAPAKRIAERLVFRKPERKLIIGPAETPLVGRPGERSAITLLVTNERGEPTPAVLGVSMVDASLQPSAAEGFNHKRCLFASAEGSFSARDIETADSLLSDDPADAASLENLLGARGWQSPVPSDAPNSEPKVTQPSPASDPPMVFDNLSQIRDQYEASLEAFRTTGAQSLKHLASITIFGGLGFAILIAMLALLSLLPGVRVWGVAMTLALGAAAVGAMLTYSDADQLPADGCPTFLSWTPTPAEAPPVVKRPAAVPVVDTKPGPISAPSPTDSGTGSTAAPSAARHSFVYRRPAGNGAEAARPQPTIYWNPLLVVGPNGRAQIELQLPDHPSNYRISVLGHTATRLGSASETLVARLPIRQTMKAPTSLVVGDSVRVPLEIVNDSDRPIAAEWTLSWSVSLKVDGDPVRRRTVAPKETYREWIAVEAVQPSDDARLIVKTVAEGRQDTITHGLKIAPAGYPAQKTLAGRLMDRQDLVLELPETTSANACAASLSVMPTASADLYAAIAGLEASPRLNLEQELSLGWLHAMTRKIAASRGQPNAALIRESNRFFSESAQRLRAFESADAGLGWFGGPTGDVAMSAYTLLTRQTPADVAQLSRQALDRAEHWLVGRCDGSGGWKMPDGASTSKAALDATAAFAIWCMAESGVEDLDREMARAQILGADSNDPYVLSLAAASLLAQRFTKDARPMLIKLASLQEADGHFECKSDSITRAAGPSLAVETTALAAIALTKGTTYFDRADRAVDWLLSQRRASGDFGSSHATALAIRAIAERAQTNRPATQLGKIRLASADNPSQVLDEAAFRPGAQEAIRLAGLEKKLQPGKNRVALLAEGADKLPFFFAVRWTTPEPEKPSNPDLVLTTQLSEAHVPVGGAVALKVEISNRAQTECPFPVAEIRVPAGLRLADGQIEKLRSSRAADSVEACPSGIHLAWRKLAPGQTVVLQIELIAASVGKFTAIPSRVSLAYQPERESWAKPLALEVETQEPESKSPISKSQ